MVTAGTGRRRAVGDRVLEVLRSAAVPLATFVVALALYVPTLLPGLGFWDTAEFQTVGPVLGIAHPTGFPAYTLVSWLASVVLAPFGSVAYRINLLSAICMAGAGALLVASVLRVVRRPAPAFAAGLVLAVAPIAWWTATQADAHALHVFLLALLLERLVAWGDAIVRTPAAGVAAVGSTGESGGISGSVGCAKSDGDAPPGAPIRAGGRGTRAWLRPGDGALVAASVVYGVSLGNHGLTVLLAPGIALYLLVVDPGILRRWRLVAACAGAILATVVALYAYIPIRASMDPPLNYAHPSTIDGFLYLVTASQFTGLLQNPFENGIGPFVDVFVAQEGWPVVAAALVGLGALAVGRGGSGRLGPRLAVLTGAWLVVTMVFSLGYGDGFIDRYYLGPLLVAAAWAAVGVSAAWGVVVDAVRIPGVVGRTRQAALTLGAAAVLAAWPAYVAATGYETNDSSQKRQAQEWGDAVLAALEPDAVVVSWWSYSTPLWYLTHVEGRRPDILIVDDRDRLDHGYGELPETIDRFRAEGRPVYLIRSEDMVKHLSGIYRLEVIPTVMGYSPLWRVLP